MPKQKIIIATISDIEYQQPLIRMANSLANNGFDVKMVGRKFKHSNTLKNYDFETKRIKVLFTKGPMQYVEYNFRLFFYLLFSKSNILTAIDLDTALAVYLASIIKQKKRVYDAREYFTELYEIVRRPKIQKFWLVLERFLMPKFKNGTVVGGFIANAYKEKYNIKYTVVRNIPILKEEEKQKENPLGLNVKYMLFQGYVNEARGFDTLIPLMQQIEMPLVICGNGNYMDVLQKLIKLHNVENKVHCLGLLSPELLLPYTQNAYLGIHLVEAKGLNQIYSLGNKFFDYIHASLPQVSVNLPEYANINSEHKIALLVNAINKVEVFKAINILIEDKNLYHTLKTNCTKAKQVLCWQIEALNLIAFYKQL